MSDSPFGDFYNAELEFDVPLSASGVDRFGDPKITTQKLLVKALLREGKIDARKMEGVDKFSEAKVGYLVEPTEMPSSISSGAIARARIKNAIGRDKVGTFELFLDDQNPFLIGANIQGLTKISGIFRAT